MRQPQTRFLLWTGFGGLLLLMLVLGSSAVSFLYQVEIRQERIRQDFVAQDRSLERLRSGLFLTGTYVRNFLLDPSPTASPVHRAEFEDARRQIEASLAECARQLAATDPALLSARRAIAEYLNQTEAVFAWTPQERAARSYSFMERELLPHRTQMLGVADRLRSSDAMDFSRACRRHLSAAAAAADRLPARPMRLVTCEARNSAATTGWRSF